MNMNEPVNTIKQKIDKIVELGEKSLLDKLDEAGYGKDNFQKYLYKKEVIQ